MGLNTVWEIETAQTERQIEVISLGCVGWMLTVSFSFGKANRKLFEVQACPLRTNAGCKGQSYCQPFSALFWDTAVQEPCQPEESGPAHAALNQLRHSMSPPAPSTPPVLWTAGAKVQEVDLLPPHNVLKMGDDFEAFLTPVPQLHLGPGCANKSCQSLKVQVCQLSPSLQQQLGAHRGHWHCLWAGICRSCLAFYCHYYVANSKWLWNATPVFRGNFIHEIYLHTRKHCERWLPVCMEFT